SKVPSHYRASITTVYPAPMTLGSYTCDKIVLEELEKRVAASGLAKALWIPHQCISKKYVAALLYVKNGPGIQMLSIKPHSSEPLSIQETQILQAMTKSLVK